MSGEKSQISGETQSPHEWARATSDCIVSLRLTYDRRAGACLAERKEPSEDQVLARCRGEGEGTGPLTHPEKLPGGIQIS